MSRTIVFRSIITCVILIALSGVGNAFGQTTVVWTGDGDGTSWSDPSNWSTEFVPGPADEAVIEMSDGGFYRITVDEASVAALTIASTRATLDITGELIVLESMTFDGGNIDGDGTLIIEGDFTWSQGNMNGPGATILLGRAVISRQSFQGLPIDRRHIEVHDTMVFERGYLAPRNGATIVIEEGASLELGEAASGIQPGYTTAVRPRLINRGLIVKRDGPNSEGAIGMSTQFGDALDIDNQGEVRSDVGTLLFYLSDNSVNEGLIISNANISISNAHGFNAEAVELGGTLRGHGNFRLTYAIDLTGEIDVEGGLNPRHHTTFTDRLSITRLGSLLINSDNFIDGGVAFRVPGTTRIGELIVDGHFDMAGEIVVENSLGIGVSQQATIIGEGQISVEPGGMARLGYGTIEGLSEIRTSQVVSFPALILAGDFPAAHSSITLRGTDLLIDDDAAWDDGDLILDDGATLVIGENATFDVQRDGRIAAGEAASGDERIVNNGVLRKSGVGTLERYEWGMNAPEYNENNVGTYIEVAFENAGTLSLEAGRTVFSSVLFQEGTITGTGILDVSEAVIEAANGTIAPGAPVGTLAVRGYLDLRDQRLEIEIAGPPSSEAYDVLQMDGDLLLDGTLEVVFRDYNPEPGDLYRIATASGSLSGDFREINLPQISGVDLNVIADDGIVFLQVEASDEAFPILTVEPTEINFPETTTGDSVTHSVTIANEGETDLLISALFVDAMDSPFTVEASDEVVAPGERIEVDVSFAPVAAGAHEATLVIRTNGGDADIRLTGSGIESDLPSPVLAVDPNQISFPETEVGESSTQVVTMFNRGEADLLISSIDVTEDDIPVFWSAFDSVLVAGDSLELALTFQPVEQGSFEAVLQIASNGGSAEIPISGTSTTPEIAAPVAVDDIATTIRGEAVVIDVLANDTDPEGGELTIVEVGQPGNGRAATDGRTITYTPAASFVGTDTFPYIIENAAGGRATATVTVTVAGFGFTIVEVSPDGGSISRAIAVSPDGLVTGVTLTSQGIAPFVWSNGKATTVGVDDHIVTPYALLDDGTMAGVAVAADSSALAVLLGTDGSLKPLGSLGGNFGVAYDLNESGATAGVSSTSQARYQAVVWDADMEAIDFGHGSHSEAFAINNRGNVAGVVSTDGGTEYAVVNGRVITTAETRAYDLNNLGMSVGSALVNGRVVAMAWDADGVAASLEDTDAGFAEAYAVSDAGWAVGVTEDVTVASKTTSMHDRWRLGARHAMKFDLSSTHAGKSAAAPTKRAALWVDGRHFNLDELIHNPEDDWRLVEARDINARGQIAGYGLRGGRIAAFLLTPIDADIPLPRSISLEAEVGGNITIGVGELALVANSDSLLVIGAEQPTYGTVEVAADGRSLTYSSIDSGAASDAFIAYVGNGGGAAVGARVEITLRPSDDTDGVLRLHPNFPNPFANSTLVGFSLQEASDIQMRLFDLLGREVKVVLDAHLAAGRHNVILSADGLASGTYILRLSKGRHVDSRAINILR